jgi:hypothetical protein
MSRAVSCAASGCAAAGAPGTAVVLEALALTMMSRAASEENTANKIATAAATKTPARIRDEKEDIRPFRTRAVYSLGSGSLS